MSSAHDQDPPREELERQANLVRSRLLDTIDAIDRRRHAMTDVRHQVRKHALPVGIGTGVLVLGIAAGIAYAVHRVGTRDERRRRDRYRALGALWNHPERVAHAKKERPVGLEIGRKILVGAVTFLGLTLAKRYIKHVALPEGPSVVKVKVLRA